MNASHSGRYLRSCGYGLRAFVLLCGLVLFAGVSDAGAADSASAATPPQQKTSARKKVSGEIAGPDGKAVPGAAVSVKDHPEYGGALSDADGRFRIDVPEDVTLLVSFLGYETEEISVREQPMPLLIQLRDADTKIEDVVVIGYGIQRKESVVGAISQIDNKALVNSGTTNISNALTGKLSGVTTIASSGQPGENDATIFIRGVSSWNGSKPLVMVDGVERDFADLDPNEIETISVLKDASATAVFGAKGANGVIIVTTKVGQTGRPKMNLSIDYGMDIPSNLPKHISSYTTAQLYNVAKKNTDDWSLYTDRELEEFRNPSSPINSLRYPDNDWFDLLMKNCASTVNANFNMSGGTDRVKYFVSLGYSHEGSIIKQLHEYKNTTFTYDRINYRSNLDFKVTKSTSLSVKVGGTLGIKQNPNQQSVGALFNTFYSASPMVYPAYYPAWALEEIPDPDYPDASGTRLAYAEGNVYWKNPYATLSSADFSQTTRNKLFTDAILNQKLDFITKGLSVNAKVSLSTYYSRVSQKAEQSYPQFQIDWDAYDTGVGNPWTRLNFSSDSLYEDPIYSVSQGTLQNTYYTTFYWEGSLNYNRKFGRHSVTALLLFNQRENLQQTDYAYRTQGLVGRVTYDFGHKYLFEANIGYTGSEQFSPKNRYGFFPSVAVGYVVSQEKFWKESLPWWSKFKLRYSDGLVGNDQTSSRWLYYSSYSKDHDGYYVEDAVANDEARWETARKRDLGIEMGWLDDQLTLNVDLFDEQRKDMLIAPVIPILVGTSFKQVNHGAMKKHGLEIELGFKRTTRYGLRYNIDLMASFNENRITDYEDAPYKPDYQKYAGSPYQGQRTGTSLVDGGYYTSVNDIHTYPSYTDTWTGNLFPGCYKFLDYNGDGSINNEDLHYIEGSAYPPVTYSIRGGLGYKGFEFSVLLYGNQGKYVDYNKSFEIEFNKLEPRVNLSQLDYWRPDNPQAGHSTMTYSTYMYAWGGGSADNGYNVSFKDHTWRKADFLTIKEIYAAYTFNGAKLKKSVGLNSLSVYVTANNVWTFTNLIEGNPMATNFSQGFYPLMTTIKLGVKVGF